jgi:hypothetical protein
MVQDVTRQAHPILWTVFTNKPLTRIKPSTRRDRDLSVTKTAPCVHLGKRNIRESAGFAMEPIQGDVRNPASPHSAASVMTFSSRFPSATVHVVHKSRERSISRTPRSWR